MVGGMRGQVNGSRGVGSVSKGLLLKYRDRWDEKVDPRSRMALSYR